MTIQQQLPPTQAARNVIEKFFGDIRFARAAELAQLDRFAEAAAVLTENGRAPENARELDLLARIAARQGHFGEARNYWNAAAKLEPQNPVYRQCLESLTPARRIARIIATHEAKLLNLLVFAIVVMVVGLLIFVFKR